MTNKYTLTKADKDFITSELYYDIEDIPQIQRVINQAKFTILETSEEITTKQAMSMLSYNDFISGVCRAAFHFSCCRKCKSSNNYVSINNYNMLDELTKNVLATT